MEKCAICYNNCDYKLRCNHYFHEECIENWKQKCLSQSYNFRCPLCRNSIEDSILNKECLITHKFYLHLKYKGIIIGKTNSNSIDYYKVKYIFNNNDYNAVKFFPENIWNIEVE